MKKLAVLGMAVFCAPSWPEDYVPGNDRINEHDILDRIQHELGDPDIHTKTQKLSTSVPAPKSPDAKTSELIQVTIILANGGRITGQIPVAQSGLKLLTNEGSTHLERILPISEIREVRFSDWQQTAVLQPKTGSQLYFLPATCTVTTKDGQRFSGHFPVAEWLQVSLRGKNAGQFRIYFSAATAPNVSAEGNVPTESLPGDVISAIELGETLTPTAAVN